MSLNLSLDLKDATLADLEAFLAAARAADSDPHAALSVDGTVMRVDVDKPRVRPVEPQKGAQQRSHFDRPVAETPSVPSLMHSPSALTRRTRRAAALLEPLVPTRIKPCG